MCFRHEVCAALIDVILKIVGQEVETGEDPREVGGMSFELCSGNQMGVHGQGEQGENFDLYAPLCTCFSVEGSLSSLSVDETLYHHRDDAPFHQMAAFLAVD